MELKITKKELESFLEQIAELRKAKANLAEDNIGLVSENKNLKLKFEKDKQWLDDQIK